DQALLARAHLHAWQLTGDPRWRQVLDETLEYVLGRLAHPSGALCAAEDADSEGEEGRYYLWSPDELNEVLGPELAPEAAAWYGVSAKGNFEGRNILVRAKRGQLARPAEIERARTLLLARRAERVAPGLDDKVLTEWNAMACSVLAECAAATGEERYATAAEQIAKVLLQARAQNNSVTPRSVRFDGQPPITGFAGDVAWLTDALTRLFELTGGRRFLLAANEVATELVSSFVEQASGIVFTTRTGGEALVVRPAELNDGVIPSAASVAALSLARLGALLGDDSLTAIATAIVRAQWEAVTSAPATVPELLSAAELLASGPLEVAATGGGRAVLKEVRRRYLPMAVFAWEADEQDGSYPVLPLLQERGGDAVHVCHLGTCRLPAYSTEEVDKEIDMALQARSGAP
ncbi:MAG: thioredoxin domain-containing protein, partial [Acidimicrobiales bacterium]